MHMTMTRAELERPRFMVPAAREATGRMKRKQLLLTGIDSWGSAVMEGLACEDEK